MCRYGIVVLNYNTYDDTKRCIDSIKKFTMRYNNYKIYVVDNASTDGSMSQIESDYNNDEMIEIIVSEYNRGFSGGNNLGINKAIDDGCEYIFLLNSDIILLNDALSYMIDCITANNAVIVGPTIYDPTMAYKQFARKALNLRSYLLSKGVLEKIFANTLLELRYYRYQTEGDFVFTGMVSGCCFGLKTTFVKQYNLLDDKVFMYYEEDILSNLLKENNLQTCICSSAKVIHNEASATRKNNSNHLLFTRLYRWTSSLYVLKNYTNTNRFIVSLLATWNIITWTMLSITNIDYRSSLKKFVSETCRVLSE